jgi:A/G-specific adenine glycosylase
MQIKDYNQYFASSLVTWYLANARNLPWRHTRNPYLIWLSEIILQQTRVIQGLPYYERFAEAYPTVTDLANAPEEEVLRLWQGLGYYSRARNLHYTAKQVATELNGIFPTEYASLLLLKGIGKYTAAAISSFSAGQKVAVVDGNVYRVLARVFGVNQDITSPQGQRFFAGLAQELIPEQDPASYNQAIMEFGALQCVPVSPRCESCPLQSICQAYATGRQQELPVKSKKTKVRPRFFHYFVITDGLRYIWMNKRGPGDIWTGLYDFLLTEAQISQAEPVPTELVSYILGSGGVLRTTGQVYKHVLSHQVIEAHFHEIVISDSAQEQIIREKVPELYKFTLEEVWQNPKPVLINNFLKTYLE